MAIGKIRETIWLSIVSPRKWLLIVTYDQFMMVMKSEWVTSFFWGDNLMENKAIFNIFPMNNETFDYDSRLFIISLWWLFAHIGENDDKPMDLLGLYRCVWLFSRENMENYDEPLLFGGWYYIYGMPYFGQPRACWGSNDQGICIFDVSSVLRWDRPRWSTFRRARARATRCHEVYEVWPEAWTLVQPRVSPELASDFDPFESAHFNDRYRKWWPANSCETIVTWAVVTSGALLVL